MSSDNKGPGFHTCSHNCHDANNRMTRVNAQVRHVHIFNTASSGALSHSKKHPKHACGKRGSGCPADDEPSSWPTKDEEYVKFANRLMAERKGVTHGKLLQQYKDSWRRSYPNRPVALMPDGLPVDHSHDPHYPCSVPWLADFLSHDPFKGSASVDDQAPEAIASTSNPLASTLNGKGKETHVVEDDSEEDDEIQELDPPPPNTIKSREGSRKPSSTVNEKPTVNGVVIKGKAKAKPEIGPPKLVQELAPEPMDMDSNDVVEHEMDVDVHETANINNNNAGRVSKIQAGRQHDDRTMDRLEEELRQALSHIKDLTGRFNELYHIRNTEPELLLERMEAQYKMQLQAQETLIENLNVQLARKDPVHRTDQLFEILTREEANREMDTLQLEVNEYKKRHRDAEKKLKEKNDDISSLQKSNDDLRLELQAEIERGNAMAIKIQRLPTSASRPRMANGLSSADNPKAAEIIKFYEDLTNLIVPNMRLQKGQYFETDEWFLNCVYSYTDENTQKQQGLPSKTISFTLRLCREPPSGLEDVLENKSQLVDTVHYLPQDLDKESPEFVEALEFLKESFTFERSQLSFFIRTLHEHMSGGGEDSSDDRSDDQVQVD